jgi:Pectic acid lyase
MSSFDRKCCRLGICAALVLGALSSVACAQWGGSQSRWRNILDYPPSFYGSDESVRVAENVLLYQNDNGGWPKNIDMARPLSESEQTQLQKTHNEPDTLIDNGATWSQIRFLALVHAATGDPRFADAALRGINYLLEAQYPNGGWPQFYPLRRGYYTHITYNDGAMMGVMNVLRDVAQNKGAQNAGAQNKGAQDLPTNDGKQPFDFVDDATRRRCQLAIDNGLKAILATQVVVDGKPTVWCAQYDETTLQPAPARSYELVSLSGSESVGVVEYLMSLDNPSPEVKRAIESAVDWFNRVKIEGQRVEWKRDPQTHRTIDRVVVDDPQAKPIWARFYAIGTDRPMFSGRDGVVRDHLADIEQERRVGYAWLGDWPSEMLTKDYPKWREKWGNEPSGGE